MSDEVKRRRALLSSPAPRAPVIHKLRRALRGDVSLRDVLLEAGRRGYVAVQRNRERASLGRAGEDAPARLLPEYERQTALETLWHFRARWYPKFFPGLDATPEAVTRLAREDFPEATAQLLKRAERILEHRWPLLGYGELDFGAQIDWLREPVSGVRWSRAYHADVPLVRADGSDVRVLWELNRLAHLVTLGRAYAVTNDARFVEEFFSQVETWRTQNPVALGPNWSCAMEVALRAMNLLAAFMLFRRAPELNERRLATLLSMFDDHGTHIRRHLEFSYISTSNHYLSDVVGLLWLGVCLPELSMAASWREFGLREMLREMDRQVLDDGADAEASTGYHRFVLELFLYSFILCRLNGLNIEEHYWKKLRRMLQYVRAYLRPDGRAPLVGDTDSGQALPLAPHAADDHSYVLAIGAATLDEPRLKITNDAPEELLWLLGEERFRSYMEMPVAPAATSHGFTNAGTYAMRDGDLYMLFNASGAGLNGRGSHGHNDALSLEVSACGRAFITDPGTYVYTADHIERHLFRSTAYHSTVEIDGAEQNSTDVRTPFIIGNEAQPRVLRWSMNRDCDLVVAEHDGYRRLATGSITHRRAVLFDKRQRLWMIEDVLLGSGEHVFNFNFHVAPGIEPHVRHDEVVELCDKMGGARLLLAALDVREWAVVEPRFSSRDYGAKEASQSVCWIVRARAPLNVAWALVPLCAGDDEQERLRLIERLRPKESRGQMLGLSNSV